ncbi:CATRA conflict system CASPASE/TPR repeat-associated protein [Micromonospora sp. NPDC050495]|uniref:CATRA conflict system CASPASE/TPR repeat-associated protein n=1 Tax=Micromonospora sp. NPDC050495 TaxID=3154936 RepID=UPI0033D17E96
MTIEVRRPALLTHAFWAFGAAGGLSEAWEAIKASGIDGRIDGLPAELAEPRRDARPDRLVILGALSAETGGRALHQALAYRTRDLIALAVLRAPNRDEVGWRDLPETAPADGDQRIGDVTVYLGLLPGSAPAGADAAAALARALRPAPPPPVDLDWQRTACGFRDGITVWELPGGRTRRRLLVLAPESREDALDRWLWSADGPVLPPLTRYLAHAARIRYQQLVLHRDLPDLDRLLDDVAASSDALAAGLRDRPDTDASTSELLRQADRLTEVRNRHAGLIDTLARTRTMSRTVRVAERNLAAALESPRFAAPGGLLDTDRQVAESATEQLHAAETYLQAELDRAGPLLVTARASLDERIRDRVDGRMLVQTSLIGALLAVLAAVQSLDYRVAVARSLNAPLITLVGALVLWLPSAVLHWIPGARVPRGWRHLDRIFLVLTCSAAGWLGTAAVVRYGGGHPAPPWASLAGAAGTALAGLGIGHWLWRTGRS